MKKRMLSIVLCVVLLLSGCGGNAASETAATEQARADAESSETGEASDKDIDETASEASDGTSGDSLEDSDITKTDPLPDNVDDILAGMTLEEKVGQIMVPAFRIWKEVPSGSESEVKNTVENAEDDIPGTNITELNDQIREAIIKYKFGGTLLYAENYEDSEQVLNLISDMQITNQKGSNIPLLVGTDQEGGSVARVNFGTTGVGNMTMAATGDVENTKKMASVFGEELSLLGITVDFAPDVDINNNPNNPVIGVRSFSDDPETVSEYSKAFIEGLAENGIIATPKHFPGHGNTDTDSHTGFPSIQSTYDELKEFELVPFQNAIDSGVDMIMTAHIQYPNIEKETYTSISTGEKIYLPATMSHRMITEILREDMGYDGVVIADALDMAAIADNFSVEDTLCMSINAGVDMLLLPQVKEAGGFDHLLDMMDTAIELAEEGKIDPDRIDESVRRILTLKKKYGILDKTDFTVTEEQIKAAEGSVGCDEHRQIALDIAEQALTLVKNDKDALPLSLKKDQNVLILFSGSASGRKGSGELAKQILEENGTVPEGTEIRILVNTEENEKECLEAADEADHVILVSRAYNADCLDPTTEDGYSTGVFDKVIEKRHLAGKQVIVVSCQLPYDAARFPEADAILVAYNSAALEEIPPKSGAGSAYVPNLQAALCACFGDGEFTGRLPVNIPELDSNYRITDKIMYRSQLK